jgi:hypothetical protein
VSKRAVYNPGMNAVWIAPLAALACFWLWFLARGRARGTVKRLALRATLLALIAGLVAAGVRRGVFAHSSFGFRLALLLAVLVVVGGYLYLVRFCSECGRMERNLKVAVCPRCGAMLPRHGMTDRLRQAGDDQRWDPLAKRGTGRRRDAPAPRR